MPCRPLFYIHPCKPRNHPMWKVLSNAPPWKKDTCPPMARSLAIYSPGQLPNSKHMALVSARQRIQQRAGTQPHKPDPQPGQYVPEGTGASRNNGSHPASHFRGKAVRPNRPSSGKIGWARCVPAPPKARTAGIVGSRPQTTPKPSTHNPQNQTTQTGAWPCRPKGFAMPST